MSASQIALQDKVRFLHVGYQCPFSLWYQEQAEELARLLERAFETADLTGDPASVAPLGAYTPMQVVIPGHPPMGAPRSTAKMVETLQAGVPERLAPVAALRPAAPAGQPWVFRPGDEGWPEAVGATVRTCLGQAAAAAREGEALAAKLAWLAGLAGAEGGGREAGPLIVLDDAPAKSRAFVELIPATASQVPLPPGESGALFLTCVHARPVGDGVDDEVQDARPWLLEAAVEAAGARVWAVCGHNTPYPNGPWPLFAGAGFAIVAELGQIGLPERGYDRLLLVAADRPGSQSRCAGLVLGLADNVATLPDGGRKGDLIDIHGPGDWQQIRATQDIPPGHKIALTELREGMSVVKYGQEIGVAAHTISPGSHVHAHNLSSGRAGGPAPDRPDGQGR